MDISLWSWRAVCTNRSSVSCGMVPVDSEVIRLFRMSEKKLVEYFTPLRIKDVSGKDRIYRQEVCCRTNMDDRGWLDTSAAYGRLSTKDDLANLTGQVQTLAEENKQRANYCLWINKAHPVGRDGKTLIAHLHEDSDVEYLMSQARKKLKGSGYVVHRDFPRETKTRLTTLRAKLRGSQREFWY
ncbi:hypothetical protein J6590_006735 [Homalodisca vitripennis]|nr:hypothetical protein J6590_006735 [Homalodisca vitripennis]